MNYTEQRRRTLAETLARHGLDVFLAAKPENVTYLTGFTGESSFHIQTAARGVLVSDTRFEEQIKEECPGLDAEIRGHDKTTYQAAADVLSRCGARAVGVEADHLTIGELELFRKLAPAVTFVPLSGTVEAQRMVKDPGEVAIIRSAVRIAERAYRMFLATARVGETEKDLVDAMEGFVRRAGGRCSSFPPIIAVGERGALPHAPPSSSRLTAGGQVLIDWGADLLYKSDITRTLRTQDEAAGRTARVNTYDFDALYEAVLRAQEAAMRAIRPGVNVREVDVAARRVLAETRVPGHPQMKLEELFTHGLGHGIGLEIHEAPSVRSNSSDVFAAGMVVTLEPGVYIPGWGGIRIEDDFLVTPDGVERLTTLPRDLSAATLVL